MPGPAGWTQYLEPDTSEPYYHNALTGETRWSRPLEWNAAAAAAAAAGLADRLAATRAPAPGSSPLDVALSAQNRGSLDAGLAGAPLSPLRAPPGGGGDALSPLRAARGAISAGTLGALVASGPSIESYSDLDARLASLTASLSLTSGLGAHDGSSGVNGAPLSNPTGSGDSGTSGSGQLPPPSADGSLF